jgi:hypothetical protein
MNIHYRIIKVDPAAHGIVIRYFTDKVTEMDLASSFNEDGSIKLNADGYPLSTRTDVLMSIYDTPAPSNEEIERRIMLNAPVDWLKLQEDIIDPEVNTKMTEARNLTGESKAFTTDDISELKKITDTDENEEQSVQKAYDTVIRLVDSLKVLAAEDPHVIKGLFDVLKDIKVIADEFEK